MASQISSSTLVVIMNLTQKYLYQFACPILMFIGTVSCILNLIVFTQKNLRKNPCSIYFIVYNIANFLYIYSSLLSLTLDVGYHIDPSAYNLVICRFRLYLVLLFNILSPFYLILASIDRILITSPNAVTRRRSTCRFAYMCIFIGTLFWILFHMHALILSTIIQLGPIYLCYFQLGVHLIFVSYYSLIKEILSLLLMILFGLWSIKNIQNIGRVRIVPDLAVSKNVLEGNTYSTSSKDRQLIFMLFMDIIIYILFSFVLAIFLVYQEITQNDVKDNDRIQIENSVRNICLFSIGIPFCSSCYVNLIVSKTFRNEIKKIFLWR